MQKIKINFFKTTFSIWLNSLYLIKERIKKFNIKKREANFKGKNKLEKKGHSLKRQVEIK